MEGSNVDDNNDKDGNVEVEGKAIDGASCMTAAGAATSCCDKGGIGGKVGKRGVAAGLLRK